MKFALAPLALVAAALAAPTPAAATWMGLADGSYQVTLQCTFSSVIDCAQTQVGTVTVVGSGLSSMAFAGINAETFSGDPADAVVDGALVDTESSTLQNQPFSFLSLRLITDGAIGQFQTGDRWWVYCNNNGATCTPNTTGLWSALRMRDDNRVDAPSTLATALAGLGLMLSAWRRRRRAAAPARPKAA